MVRIQLLIFQNLHWILFKPLFGVESRKDFGVLPKVYFFLSGQLTQQALILKKFGAERYSQELAAMVHLSVTPEVSLADLPVKIYASGLAPSQLVTLHASLTDEKGMKFVARAFYQANQNGEVDVAQASALGGPGPFPGLIDLFGGAGGLIEFRAGLLASKGFAVLALAFFAYDDLPQTLEVIDLEYFEEASRLLLKNPKVRGPGLGVIGLSKGAEIALAMSTFLKEVVASVSINGPTRMTGTSLHFHDVRIPETSYPSEKVVINEMGLASTFYCLGHPLDQAPEVSAIPVEKAQGHILFVVGEADQSLNSKVFAEAAMARAKKHGNNNCSLLSYPGAGHLIEPPGSPVCYAYPLRFSLIPIQWGGEMKPHAKAQEHSWNEILNFFKLHLGPLQNSSL
ncbi:PREDICTED: bile acid-CoA:amino acid N-acyltransferase isoform X4 [Thamnophis sirtalis]|uniref:Bile acid-CoA:amino acid N-acyltransferase isoform X4 n=1 Tax=Thamnophis sirtalis TaxID=35019 RepID=A0A6I9X2F1_9SAUR|nr:PREDICTED: bile acid-CoA:amino acid N-acyltransferase isoform X4 [Thamnophis sirtalis]